MSISVTFESIFNSVWELSPETIEVEAGKRLFSREKNDSGFYHLLEGDAVIETIGTDERLQIMPLEARHVAGSAPEVAKQQGQFAIYCASNCRFHRYQWQQLQKSTDAYKTVARALAPISHRVRSVLLVLHTFKQTYPDVSQAFLQALIDNAEFSHLDENKILSKPGDSSRVMYFLVSGKIDVYVGNEPNLKRVGEIFHGEPFGEMSLFSDEARKATLVATRRSDLISLNRQKFDRLSVQFPWLSTYIVTNLINRIKKQNARQRNQQLVNRLILDLDPARNQRQIVKLAAELEQLNDVITLEKTASKFSNVALTQILHEHLADYLDDIEQQKPINLYLSSIENMDWCKLCLERTDEVWLVVNVNSSAAQIDKLLNPLKPIFSWQKQTRKLILVQHSTATTTNTLDWKTTLDVSRHFHLYEDDLVSAQRLCRIISNQSVGLVLGGGGARGFAQVGVLQAMHEVGVPVDWVGGTSIGSILSGWIARGWDVEQIREAVNEFFVKVNPLGDYTLPIVSLSKSQRLDKLLRKGLGTGMIEDLPIPYFCVSSDMSSAEERHHEHGLLWRAVRASISIPGIIAPVIEDGHYLVDGGLFNNLPCDLMRKRNAGPVIAIDVSTEQEYITELTEVPSPWEIILNKVYKKKQIKVPSILDTLVRSSLLASAQRQKNNRDLVDFYFQPKIDNLGLLDFKLADTAIQAGYRQSMEYFAQNAEKLKPSANRIS